MPRDSQETRRLLSEKDFPYHSFDVSVVDEEASVFHSTVVSNHQPVASSSRLRPVVGGFVIGAVCLLAVASLTSEPTSQVSTNLSSDSSDVSIVVSNEYVEKYGPISTQLSWVASSGVQVIDVYKTAELSVTEPSYTCEWRVSAEAASNSSTLSPDPSSFTLISTGSSSVSHSFEGLGYYSVLADCTSSSSSGSLSLSTTVAAKYVRREVRSLTPADLDAFLVAMEYLYGLHPATEEMLSNSDFMTMSEVEKVC